MLRTSRSVGVNIYLDALILSLNRSVAGWANYFRHGVSKATFNAIDSFVWGRLMRWTRAKYQGRTGLSMKELRRRFCDQGWRFAHDGVAYTGASSVTVERYRYRGSTIATPWTHRTGSSHHRQLTNGQDTRSARCMETRTPGAAGGPGEPTGSDPGRARRSDPTNRLQRCYERRENLIEAFFDLADAIITLRSLIRRAWTTHRWDNRPAQRP